MARGFSAGKGGRGPSAWHNRGSGKISTTQAASMTKSLPTHHSSTGSHGMAALKYKSGGGRYKGGNS